MRMNKMKTTEIKSKLLPAIDDSMKECVNSGQWLLFKSGGHHKACYFLKIVDDIYALDRYGQVIEQLKASSDSLGIEERLYFSDHPRPISLSNLAAA